MAENRNTIQKMKILEYLHSTKTHPSAEEVHKEVLKSIPNITLATVYRNLNTLADQGVIDKIKSNSKWRFDGHQGNHEHAICKQCGTIIDVKEHQAAKKTLSTTKIRGFRADSAHITFMGYCTHCLEQHTTR